MARMLVVFFFLLLLAGISFAQSAQGGSSGGSGSSGGAVSGGGSTGGSGTSPFEGLFNNSPTPLNGFTLFSMNCSANVFQQLRVCGGGTCSSSSPDFICSSPFSLLGGKECVGVVQEKFWGFSPVSGVCCNENGSCGIPTSSVWAAGIFSSEPVSVNNFFPEWDARRAHSVRLGNGSWIVVADEATGGSVFSSSDNGETWSVGFPLQSLISSFPSSYQMNQLETFHPALALGSNGIVHLAFTVRHTPSGKSSLYYALCSAGNCGTRTNWSMAIPILNGSDETDPQGATGSGSAWKYRFGFPDIRVTSSAVHILFDDQEMDSAQRIQGIFHRFCNFSSDCTMVSEWDHPLVNPDVTNGVHNGFPHSPSGTALANDRVGVSWIDYSSAGSVGVEKLFVSEYVPTDSQSGVWVAALTVGTEGDYSSPTLLVSSDTWRLVSQKGNGVSAYACGGLDCVSDPTEWVDESAVLAAFTNVSGLSRVVGFVSPFDDQKWGVLSDGLDTFSRRIQGMLITNNLSSSIHFLSPPGIDFWLRGVSATASGVEENFWEWMDFVGENGNEQTLFSTNILESQNSPPVISSIVPAQGDTWTNPGLGVSPLSLFEETISFTLQDGDPDDEVYISVFLGDSIDGTDYPLLEYVNVTSPESGTSPCASTKLTNPQPCALDLPLFVPGEGVKAPEGTHFLVVRAHDTGGGSATLTYPAPITINSVSTSLFISQPVSGSKWSTQTPHTLVFSANGSAFVQTLKIGMMANGGSANAVDVGTISLATGLTVASGCTKNAASVSCSIPLVPPSTLPEGVFSLDLSVNEDGVQTASQSVSNVVLDFHSPHLLSFSPAGSVPTIPSVLSFTLTDFSGIDGNFPILVSVNGSPSNASPSCVPQGIGSLSCTLPFSASLASLQSDSPYFISITSTDGLGNNGLSSFSFSVQGNTIPPNEGGGGGGGGGIGILPLVETLVEVESDGDISVTGTGIVIPHTIVETVDTFSRTIILSATHLVEVTGPSAYAIFIGLCALAGLVSDSVFRRVFSHIVSETQHQRERVMRAVLVGIFVVIPLVVGLQISLPIGFIFVVLEMVSFVGVSYGYKLLHDYHAFGFTPIAGVENPSGKK